MKHERLRPDDEFPPLTKRQLAELERRVADATRDERRVDSLASNAGEKP